jgi:hypothetical protein
MVRVLINGVCKVIINKNVYGDYVISEVVNGYLVTKQYIGYTKKQAIKRFNSEIVK